MGPRWPTWPTEIEQLAATFRADAKRSEDERYAALLALDDYPTAVIAKVVAAAVDDPATSVQRQAMGMCVARRILACRPAAARRARASDGELSTRVRALEVLALDATPPEWSAILVDAVDDPLPGLQIAALGVIGLAPLAPDRAAELALRLRAKLADVDPEVRAASCRAIGLRRDGLAVPVLLRALEDPDPVVIEAAVEALAALESPGALPALTRTLDDAATQALQRKTILAIATLPSREAERALLDRLRPASDTMREWILHAAASRATVSDAFLEEVAALLRDPELGEVALRLLAAHGVRAHRVLRDALESGVEPSLAAAITDVLTATDALTLGMTLASDAAPTTAHLSARIHRLAPPLTAPEPTDRPTPAARWRRAMGAETVRRSGAASSDRPEFDRRPSGGRPVERLPIAGLVAVDDALARALPADVWIEALWSALRTVDAAATLKPRDRARHARAQHVWDDFRWSPLAAAELERLVRDRGTAGWVRCAAWAALSGASLPRRQRRDLGVLAGATAARGPEGASRADPALAQCAIDWPLLPARRPRHAR